MLFYLAVLAYIVALAFYALFGPHRGPVPSDDMSYKQEEVHQPPKGEERGSYGRGKGATRTAPGTPPAS